MTKTPTRTIETCFNMTVLNTCNKCRSNYSDDSEIRGITYPKIDKNCSSYIPYQIEIPENTYQDLLEKEAEKRLVEEIVYFQTTEADYRKLSN